MTILQGIIVSTLLALTCVAGLFPSGAYAAPGGGPVAIVSTMPMMTMMMRGHSFDGARTIEEYADRLAQNDNFKKTKIILTLQAGFFIEKAQEKLDGTEAIRYSKVLNAIGEHPSDWPKFAEIPDYSPKSPLGVDMVKLLEQDKSLLDNESLSEKFKAQAKDLYMNVRDFAYSMGYVRLFDNYFEYPGNPLISREARNTLPAGGQAREMKESQDTLDNQMMDWFYRSMTLIVGAFVLMLLVVMGGSFIRGRTVRQQG